MSELAEITGIANGVLPSSFLFLVDGYMQYSDEVIRERAIIGIDGLKPSQRRILVASHDIEKIKNKTKCATVVGATMKLHPHGDASIYQTLCKMTDMSEMMNVPLIAGKGRFQKSYSNEPSAAARYTECSLLPIVEEYFNDKAGVTMIPNYDNSLTEPEALGVSFPSLLCNPSIGVAVGIASNIPSFNYHDVLNATIELIETGTIAKPLVPDFPTKCEYVYDEKELTAIMQKGRGKIKLRGSWVIDNKTIIINEIPYYTSIQRIDKVARDMEGVVKCRDLSGYMNGKTTMQLQIECSSKESAQTVLQQLLKSSDLQMCFTSNIAVIINNKPRIIGVTELLKEWVAFRKGVLNRRYTLEKQAVEFEISRYETIVALLSDDDLRERYFDAAVKNENLANKILRAAFPRVNNNILEWIMDLKIRQLSKLNKFKEKLAGYKLSHQELCRKLSDLDAEIVSQLKILNTKYTYPRHTRVTDVDYTFDVVKHEESYPVYVTIQDKFIKKNILNSVVSSLLPKTAIQCMSNDYLVLIDNKGRVLRINLENIPLSTSSDRGTYVATYCGIPDDFKIVDYGLMTNREVTYLYADGYVSVFNYGSALNNKKVTKVATSGITKCTDLIRGRFDNSAEYIYVLTNKKRFAFVENNFMRKSSSARTKFINLKKDEVVVGCKVVSKSDLFNIMPSFMEHIGKLGVLSDGEIFNTEYFKSI